MRIAFDLPPDAVNEIARRAADLVCKDLEAQAASPWLDLRGAGRYLNRSPDAVRKLVERRKLHAYRDGRRYDFHRDDLDRFVRGPRDPGRCQE